MFRNFVNNGREITVPQRDVTIGGWTGTGYIVMNQDGTGAYMISRGLAGGLIILSNLSAGFGDGVSLGTTKWLRQNIDWLYDPVDYDSPMYYHAHQGGTVWFIGTCMAIIGKPFTAPEQTITH